MTRYWFPAKRLGWGWGLPATWQGWASVIIFTVLVAAAGFLTLPRNRPVEFVVSVVVLSLCLTGICWAKGEPPRWRWGGDDEGPQT